MIKEITVKELKHLKDSNADFCLIDVREPSEYAICNINGKLIPSKELPERLDEIDPEQQIIIHCKGGGRSGRAVEFLQQQGYVNVFNLKGGIMAWIDEIDPGMSRY